MGWAAGRLGWGGCCCWGGLSWARLGEAVGSGVFNRVLSESFGFWDYIFELCGWAGLGWAGLGWAGVLGWAGLGCAELSWAGLSWLGWAGLGWAGLGWAGLGWAGGWAGLWALPFLGWVAGLVWTESYGISVFGGLGLAKHDLHCRCIQFLFILS